MRNLSSQGEDLILEKRLIRTIILLQQLPMTIISLLREDVSSVVSAETTTSLRTRMPPLLILISRTKETSKLRRGLKIIVNKEGPDLAAIASKIKLMRDQLRVRTISALADNATMATDLTKNLLLPLLALTALISVTTFLLDSSNSKTEDQPGLKTKDLINSNAILSMDVPMPAMEDVVVMVSSLSLLDLLRSKQ